MISTYSVVHQLYFPQKLIYSQRANDFSQTCIPYRYYVSTLHLSALLCLINVTSSFKKCFLCLSPALSPNVDQSLAPYVCHHTSILTMLAFIYVYLHSFVSNSLCTSSYPPSFSLSLLLPSLTPTNLAHFLLFCVQW